MRIALGIEYDGAPFHGWQLQTSAVPTVQAVLEVALSRIAAQPVRVHCAGRTDTGVHACGQVVHFDTDARRPLTAWVRGGNACLPESVVVRWAREVTVDFHARFAAEARRYRYVLLNRTQRPALLANKVGWFHRPLDVDAMRQAAGCLLGTHDFSSFRDAQCQARSPLKTLHALNIQATGDFVIFDFCANAFLHHMVRNIVGALVAIGSAGQPPGWMASLLAERDRRRAAPTFAADGLYLTAIDYAAHWGLPVGAGWEAGIIPSASFIEG